MPKAFVNTLANYAGSVNSQPFAMDDNIYPVGCVLFTGAESEPIANPADGLIIQEIAMNFLANYATEWNKFLAPDGLWHYINTKPDGSGNRPFRYLDHNVLFGDTFPLISQFNGDFPYVS
jgi:hypothetical protein